MRVDSLIQYHATQRPDSPALTMAGRPELPASCGRQNAITEMRIVDDEGNALADGELGEIAVKSTSVMLEYWKRPEQTAKAIRNDWLYTGDIEYRDPDGYSFLMDRKNDVVISGGENIYPNEVERALLLHECIGDVAVSGVPDDKFGEALLAGQQSRHRLDFFEQKEFTDLSRLKILRQKAGDYRLETLSAPTTSTGTIAPDYKAHRIHMARPNPVPKTGAAVARVPV